MLREGLWLFYLPCKNTFKPSVALTHHSPSPLLYYIQAIVEIVPIGVSGKV